ncbi:hypothetical protein E1212_18440 [Jiangella ureilytica]|uniref:Insertion element IS150 protein InsJ-like helix-turn-helix domain-containing protein n=1 Tax=Jiangella ureilytica TaxID=2530374 RepID=A0A4R4RK37_9ACTN|nr:hypothetical protein E1212_18440 [Jiangella ureilytica]
MGAGCVVGCRAAVGRGPGGAGGASVVEVAVRAGVSRQSVHTWIGWYLSEGIAGLADRSHRPKECPHQVTSVVEIAVAEMRREHPRWVRSGARRRRHPRRAPHHHTGRA